jgi:hypothetical protein
MTTFDPDTLQQDRNILKRIVSELDGKMALDCAVVQGASSARATERRLVSASGKPVDPQNRFASFTPLQTSHNDDEDLQDVMWTQCGTEMENGFVRLVWRECACSGQYASGLDGSS